MSKSEHTPGPWAAETGYVMARHGDLTTFVADCGRNAEVCAANARLIAAAPDLLAACKLLADYADLDVYGKDDRGEKMLDKAIAAAYAVIAKAEGKDATD